METNFSPAEDRTLVANVIGQQDNHYSNSAHTVD